MRYLGLDYGSRTLGVSVSDELGIIASNIKTIRYESEEKLFEELSLIINEYDIKEFVLGLPLNLNGTESVRSALTREFGNRLEKKFNIKVNYQDERFTTTEAERLLIQNNTSRLKRKKVIDSIAAVLILQTFLDRK